MEIWNTNSETDGLLAGDWDIVVEMPNIGEVVGSAAPTTPPAPPATPTPDPTPTPTPGINQGYGSSAGGSTEGNTGGSSGGSSSGNSSSSHSSGANKPSYGGDTFVELTEPVEEPREAEWTTETTGPKEEIVEITIMDNLRTTETVAVTAALADTSKAESGSNWVPIAGFLGVLVIALLLKATGLGKNKQHKTRGDAAK